MTFAICSSIMAPCSVGSMAESDTRVLYNIEVRKLVCNYRKEHQICFIADRFHEVAEVLSLILRSLKIMHVEKLAPSH